MKLAVLGSWQTKAHKIPRAPWRVRTYWKYADAFYIVGILFATFVGFWIFGVRTPELIAENSDYNVVDSILAFILFSIGILTINHLIIQTIIHNIKEKVEKNYHSPIFWKEKHQYIREVVVPYLVGMGYTPEGAENAAEKAFRLRGMNNDFSDVESVNDLYPGMFFDLGSTWKPWEKHNTMYIMTASHLL